MLIRICKEGAYEQTLGEFDCCTWLDISPLDNGKKESLQTRIERHSAGKILAAAVSGDDAPESLMQEQSQLGAMLMLYCIGWYTASLFRKTIHCLDKL